MKANTTLLFLISALLFLGGCLAVPKYDEEPRISFNSVRKFTFINVDQGGITADSLQITINFQDGNGDIGYPTDQRNADNINYFLTIFRQTAGEFQEVILPPGFNYNGYTPLLSPTTISGPIDGTITYKIVFNHSFSQAVNDTLRFRVQIKDRAGNLSNAIDTDPVIIRQQ
jgi:hypothetical protein